MKRIVVMEKRIAAVCAASAIAVAGVAAPAASAKSPPSGCQGAKNALERAGDANPDKKLEQVGKHCFQVSDASLKQEVRSL